MNFTTGLAIVAGVGLALADYAIIAASFVYRPLPGEVVLVVILVILLLGILLRRPSLVYASQVLAVAAGLLRMVQGTGEVSAGTILLVGGALATVAALTWLVARALPRRRDDAA